jgi:hypothetical protein
MRRASPSGGGGTVVLDEVRIREEKLITEPVPFLTESWVKKHLLVPKTKISD